MPALAKERPISGHGIAGWEIAVLAAVLAVAFALRLAWMLIIKPEPNEITSGDPFFYDVFARFLAQGQGFVRIGGQATAQWPPGYPAVLAIIYKILGHKIVLAKLLNVFLGTATCLLAHLIGRKVFGRTAGLVAASALAVFPSQVFQPTLVMSETLATFLVAALVCGVVFFAMESITWQRAATIGAFIGVITYVRGETILLALALVVVWAVASRSWLKGLRYGGVALVATALVILPWVVRNWVEMGYPILMSTGSGENLIAGHWSGADGKGSFVPVIEIDQMYAGVPFPKNETLVYKEQTRRAISFAMHNPAKELKLIPQKLYEFYRGDAKVLLWIQKGTLDNPAFSSTAQSHWETLANVYYLVILGVAVVGAPFWLSLRDPRRLLLLMIVVYYSALFGFVFIGEQRFHSSLLPLLSLFAAVSLVTVVQRVRTEIVESSKAHRAGQTLHPRRRGVGGDEAVDVRIIVVARGGLAAGHLPHRACPASHLDSLRRSFADRRPP